MMESVEICAFGSMSGESAEEEPLETGGGVVGGVSAADCWAMA